MKTKRITMVRVVLVNSSPSQHTINSIVNHATHHHTYHTMACLNFITKFILGGCCDEGMLWIYVASHLFAATLAIFVSTSARATTAPATATSKIAKMRWISMEISKLLCNHSLPNRPLPPQIDDTNYFQWKLELD